MSNGSKPVVDKLREQLRELDSRFKNDRTRHKYTALWVQLMTALLAAIATVLLGWQQEGTSECLKNAALICNATITVFAAYELFFQPRRLWMQETVVLNSLRDLKRDFDLEIAETQDLTRERVEHYRDRMKAILDASLEAWKKDKTGT